jgi:hypothetical protein
LYCGPISQHMRGGKEQFKILPKRSIIFGLLST